MNKYIREHKSQKRKNVFHISISNSIQARSFYQRSKNMTIPNPYQI